MPSTSRAVAFLVLVHAVVGAADLGITVEQVRAGPVLRCPEVIGEIVGIARDAVSAGRRLGRGVGVADLSCHGSAFSVCKPAEESGQGPEESALEAEESGQEADNIGS